MMNQNILLGVNIDHAATLRQARYREHMRDCGQQVEPDPVTIALAAERAGADGITVHLREDRRHIQESDVRRLRECIQTRLNLEMACTDEMLDFAMEIGPDAVCLVPENREEVTTEGGLDVVKEYARVKKIVDAMNEAQIDASLFIDPDVEQIEMAAKLKAPFIELHTGAFANAYYTPECMRYLDTLCEAAELAHKLGLHVNAGHGINYTNIADIITIPCLHELNIGHSILSRSMITGIGESVAAMKSKMRGGI